MHRHDGSIFHDKLMTAYVWFRNQTIPYELTYPTQNVSTANFGTWPIIYEGVDCQVGNSTLQYHFLSVSTVVRNGVCVSLACAYIQCRIRNERSG